jgi:hypothetical protein
MNTLANAWDAFLRAIEEARTLQERGGNQFAIAELVRHARELLDIVDEELADQLMELPLAARNALMQMREKVQRLERDLTVTKQ